MAPLVKKLEKQPEFESLCCLTGQHRQMLDSVVSAFGLHADYDLRIMEKNQSLSSITTRILLGLDPIFERVQPDMVLVHGDTSTAFAAALAAFYHRIPVGHVEAGLRTHNPWSPYPEEMNRTLVGDLAALHFAPTISCRENLRAEGITGHVFVTGNTVIDALHMTVRPDYRFADATLDGLDWKNRRIITLTCHRRENYGQPMENIMGAVRRIAQEFPDTEIVYPVHLSPVVRECARRNLGGVERIHLIEPLDVEQMHNLIARSYLILTDSGGLQEEAPAFGRPVLVLRRETERPEAIEAGTARLAGVETQTIVDTARQLLSDPAQYGRMAKAVNPYGDGKAADRIIQAICAFFDIADPPADFLA